MLADAISQLLQAKVAARRRPSYIRSLRQYLAQFARGREQVSVDAISVRDLDSWFASRHEAPATQASNVGRLSALFSFSVRRGWLHANPCDRLERIVVEQAVPRILTVDQAQTLMTFATDHLPHALAWFALCLFAGLRPGEADRMTWSAVNGDTVTIDAAASKVRRRRIVHLMPAAASWLALAREMGSRLPLPYPTRRRALRRAREALGFTSWPQDILRHSAASYWLAAVRDPGRVACELGNSPGILLRHYQELVAKEEAETFWNIKPPA